MTHPRVMVRGARSDTPRKRAIVYSPSKMRLSFIVNELEQDSILTIARSVSSIVGALVDDPAPVPQILVLDLEALSPVELIELHAIRHRGWCGTIIALGHVPHELRRSLAVDRVFTLPMPCDALREAVTGIRFDAQTIRIPTYAADLLDRV